MYAGVVAERRGATVHRHWWSRQPSEPFEPEIEGWVCDEIGGLLDGIGDALWDGAKARRLSPYVLEVEGADHGMQVPGPVGESVAVLGRVVTAMDEFLDAIAWPG